MIARGLAGLLVVSVALLGVLMILSSPAPVRVAIAVGLAGILAVLLGGLAVITLAGPLAPLIVVLVAVWGPFPRWGNVGAVVASLLWSASLALAAHRRAGGRAALTNVDHRR